MTNTPAAAPAPHQRPKGLSMTDDEFYAMLYQMERVIVTARKYPDMMDASPMSGRNTVAGKLAGELHALEQMPQYKQFHDAAGLWEQIWGQS